MAVEHGCYSGRLTSNAPFTPRFQMRSRGSDIMIVYSPKRFTSSICHRWASQKSVTGIFSTDHIYGYHKGSFRETHIHRVDLSRIELQSFSPGGMGFVEVDSTWALQWLCL